MKKSDSVFEFDNYKLYLASKLPVLGAGRGARSRLATALRCQTAFISRVLNGPADFSTEHAISINRFLEHSEEESDFFLLLVQLARAGSKELQDYYRGKIGQARAKREMIAERIHVKAKLSSEDQMTYYSAWYYSAIHTLLLVPECQTKKAIADYLKLPLSTITDALDFLVSIGMANRNGDRFKPGKNRIHLSNDSPMVSKHHMNWRMRAVQAMDRNSKENLFYSGPICISEEDFVRIKTMTLKLLEEIEPIIAPSPEEGIFCMSFDLFRV